MTTIDIPVGGTIVKAYIATPEGAAPAPAVCVIHDALGMTQDAHQQANWLANEGYLVAVPDLFDGRTLMGCLRSVFRDYMRGEGLLFDKVEAVRQWLLQHKRSTGKVGIIGFCFGGGFALLLAPRGDFDVASVNYGSLPKDADDFLQGACPIVASYGGRDRSLRGAAAQLEAILTKANIDHDVKEYANAQHAFMNDHSQTKIPPILHVISFFSGGGDYHEASAEDARERIVAFFEKHLKA
jgi:carboxymethylenebutenolidase